MARPRGRKLAGERLRLLPQSTRVDLSHGAPTACNTAHTQDGLHLELLDLRAHVWGVEQDVQKIAKSGESDRRP